MAFSACMASRISSLLYFGNPEPSMRLRIARTRIATRHSPPKRRGKRTVLPSLSCTPPCVPVKNYEPYQSLSRLPRVIKPSTYIITRFGCYSLSIFLACAMSSCSFFLIAYSFANERTKFLISSYSGASKNSFWKTFWL